MTVRMRFRAARALPWNRTGGPRVSPSMTEAEALADVRARIAALESAPTCLRCQVRRAARIGAGVFASFVVVALGVTVLAMIAARCFTFPPVGVN